MVFLPKWWEAPRGPYKTSTNTHLLLTRSIEFGLLRFSIVLLSIRTPRAWRLGRFTSGGRSRGYCDTSLAQRGEIGGGDMFQLVHMNDQLITTGKGLLAYLAYVGLLPGVNAHVNHLRSK